MTRRLASLVVAGLLALASAAAQAQQLAETARSVHLRAGPGRSYPVVAILPPRMAITVYGCIGGYSWCDVQAGPDRGWVYAGNVLYAYDNREVLLPGVAALVGIGIVTFVLEDYWHDYYVDRWWWPQRDRWWHPAPVPPVHSPPPYRMPPPHAGPPPHPMPPPHTGPQTHPVLPGGQPHRLQPPPQVQPQPGHPHPRPPAPRRQGEPH